MYVTQAELKKLIREAKRTGEVSERLALVVVQIAGGLYQRYRFTAVSREDFEQEAVLLLLRKLKRIKLNGNRFSFLTTCFRNAYNQAHRNRQNAEAGQHRYYQDRRWVDVGEGN